MPLLDEPPNCALELVGLLDALLVAVVECFLISGSSLWPSSRGMLLDALGLLMYWSWLILLSLDYVNLSSIFGLHASVWL